VKILGSIVKKFLLKLPEGYYQPVISKVNYDPSGYGSMHETTKHAKAFDRAMALSVGMKGLSTAKLIQSEQHVETNGTYQELSVDLLFLKHLTCQDYDMAMLCIDTIT
jgi:hypothetical protein